MRLFICLFDKKCTSFNALVTKLHPTLQLCLLPRTRPCRCRLRFPSSPVYCVSIRLCDKNSVSFLKGFPSNLPKSINASQLDPSLLSHLFLCRLCPPPSPVHCAPVHPYVQQQLCVCFKVVCLDVILGHAAMLGV